jgi:CheY-like chemotaxis protein
MSDMVQEATRRVVVALHDEVERQAITELLQEMALRVYQAHNSQQVIVLLEDHRPCDLLIFDTHFDHNPWPVINALREIAELSNIPKMILTDNREVAWVGMIQLERPFSMMRLRQVLMEFYQTQYNHDLSA